MTFSSVGRAGVPCAEARWPRVSVPAWGLLPCVTLPLSSHFLFYPAVLSIKPIKGQHVLKVMVALQLKIQSILKSGSQLRIHDLLLFPSVNLPHDSFNFMSSFRLILKCDFFFSHILKNNIRKEMECLASHH